MVFFVRITVNQSHLRPICKSTKFNPKIQRTIYSINFQRLRLHVLDFIRTVVKAFNDVYQYARQNMNLPAPIYGHHVENIVHYVDGEHPEMMHNLMHFVNESKEQELTGFIGGPPCPDFSVAGKE